MNLFIEAFAWLTDPVHWSGANGIPVRLMQHLGVTLLAIVIAGIVAVPTGVLIGHTGKGAGVVGGLAGAARALPTLGVLTLLGMWFGIGLTAPLLALIVLAIPSLLAGAYAGIQSVDRAIPAAARAIGFSPSQVILRAELPLALPVLVGGLRAATLQVVSTATLAAYTADLGLGRYLFAGLKSRDYAQMLAGALLVVVLTVALELILAAWQRAAAARYAHPEKPRGRGRQSGRAPERDQNQDQAQARAQGDTQGNAQVQAEAHPPPQFPAQVPTQTPAKAEAEAEAEAEAGAVPRHSATNPE